MRDAAGHQRNSPAITSAPTKMAIIALRCRLTRCRHACTTASGGVASAKIESRSIGLHRLRMRSSWIHNEVAATITMSATQIQPMVRRCSVPLGPASEGTECEGSQGGKRMQLDGAGGAQKRRE